MTCVVVRARKILACLPSFCLTKNGAFGRNHAPRSFVSAPLCVNRPSFHRFLSVASRGWNEKQRAEAATALLIKCDIELPGRNTFDIHTKSNHQLSVERHTGDTIPANVNENDLNGESKAVYMDPNVVDPFKLMEPQLRAMKESVKLLVTADNPLLQKVQSKISHQTQERIRPSRLSKVLTPPPRVPRAGACRCRLTSSIPPESCSVPPSSSSSHR